MDELFTRPPRRFLHELNIVPVIDLFTIVIFFMLLSTTFIAFTKLTVPPAKVSSISDPLPMPPLSPKLVLLEAEAGGGGYRLALSWAGQKPGRQLVRVPALEGRALAERLGVESRRLVEEFSRTYPSETSLRLGLGSRLSYQQLISVMDGVRERIPDIVLISYEEADATPGGAD